MKTVPWLGLVILAAPLLLAGCGGADKSKDAADRQYDVKGKVVDIAPDRQSVKLDHEDIPGLMKGMKMKFRVEDAKVLDGLQPGDAVQGRLKVQAGDYILTRLEKR
jgi:Cu/Ag efflux protein CusF